MTDYEDGEAGFCGVCDDVDLAGGGIDRQDAGVRGGGKVLDDFVLVDDVISNGAQGLREFFREIAS